MSWKSRCAIAALSVMLAACVPETDRDSYGVGDAGSATFRNELRVPLYLGGCSHFDYEKRVGDAWVSQGSDVACVWEGFAEKVPPGGVVRDPIHTRAPGRWRLRYAVGLGCSDRQPLGPAGCQRVVEITSNEFDVVADAGAGCVVAGCSSELCVRARLGDVATPCLWLPIYECLRGAECGAFGPDGSCGWRQTPEVAECLETEAEAMREEFAR